MASPTITTLINTARTLATAHLSAMESYRDTQPLQCNIMLGCHRLVIQHNSALYCVVVIDLRGDTAVLVNEWDSSVVTAIEQCARTLGVE